MTKALFNPYRAALLDNGVDLISGNVKIAALSSTYVLDLDHQFHSSLTGIVATSANLGTKTAVDGYFDSAAPNLGSPAGGSVITQLVLYLDTGSSATSPLVAYTDEDASGNPLSISTNGEQINLTPDALGYFRV